MYFFCPAYRSMVSVRGRDRPALCIAHNGGALGNAFAQSGMTVPAGTPASDDCARASITKGEPADTPVGDAARVAIGICDVYFGANLITIPAETDVKFTFHNFGNTTHTFVVDTHNNDDVENLDIIVAVDPGQHRDVTINAPEDDYYLYCEVPGNESAGMWGIIRVENDANISVQSVRNLRDA